MLHIAELGICTINYSGDYDFKGAKESDSTDGKSQRILHVNHHKHGVTSSSIPPLLCCSPLPQWIPLLCGRCTPVSHGADQQVS